MVVVGAGGASPGPAGVVVVSEVGGVSVALPVSEGEAWGPAGTASGVPGAAAGLAPSGVEGASEGGVTGAGFPKISYRASNDVKYLLG